MATEETLAVILNQGGGALITFLAPSGRSLLQCLDTPVIWRLRPKRTLWGILAGIHGNYQIKVYSKQMTADELKQILTSLHQN